MTESKKLYSPCFMCANRTGGHGYTEECDNTCDYTHTIMISRLKPYGTIDEIIEVLQGERIPVTLLDKDHMESTYGIVCAAKEGLI